MNQHNFCTNPWVGGNNKCRGSEITCWREHSILEKFTIGGQEDKESNIIGLPGSGLPAASDQFVWEYDSARGQL